jgi:hypothetical protein
MKTAERTRWRGRRLPPDLVEEIKANVLAHGIKAAARMMGLDRNTIRKHFRSAQVAPGCRAGEA